jgi:hypothetical protein
MKIEHLSNLSEVSLEKEYSHIGRENKQRNYACAFA